jgi:predicted phage-related endonuclease
MGHVMQPVIGRLAQERLRINLKDADYMLSHPKETWLKSHFDFISEDGKILVEAKNYNAAVRNKFDVESLIVPHADLAQCIHEAACHNVDRVVLAVLFGGQNFEVFDFQISPEQKEQLIKDMSQLWARVQLGQPLEAETTEQAKLMYAKDNGTYVTANHQIERAASMLKMCQSNIKSLEEQEEQLKTALQGFMRDSSELVGVDGKVLATWKSSKGSKKFDAKLFQQAMPDIYEQFIVDVMGSRRFLIKG